MAEDQKRAFRGVLGRAGIYAAALNVHQIGLDGYQAYETKLHPQARVDVKRAGDWRLSAYWCYSESDTPGEPFLVESSVGLNLAAVPPGVALRIRPGRQSVCLVRYDYDVRDAVRLHLNLSQSDPLQNRVHWRTPVPQGTSGQAPWDSDELVRLLLDDGLAADLAGNGWP